MLKRARNYVQAGAMMQGGYERMGGQHKAGQQFYRWGNSFYRTSGQQKVIGPQILGGATAAGDTLLNAKGSPILTAHGRPISGKSVSIFGKSVSGAAAMSAAGVAGSAYYMYLGYKG
jgi:hypothetical protein